MDSINNVCRLCSTAQNLMWVFDRKLDCVEKVDLVHVISSFTGIEILAEDKISQKICTQCYQISVRVNEFRKRARKINRDLMERYSEMLKLSSVVHESLDNGVSTKKQVQPNMETEEVTEPTHKIHQSVKDLLKLFPRLNLPPTWLKSDIEPCIMLEKDTVENFLKEKTKNEQESARMSKPDHRIAEEHTDTEVFIGYSLSELQLYSRSNEDSSEYQVSGNDENSLCCNGGRPNNDLSKCFPRLNFPSTWLTCNIDPYVMLEKDTVKNFLKKGAKSGQKSITLSKPDHRIAKVNTSIVSGHLRNSDTMNTEKSSEENSIMVPEIVDENANNDDSDYDSGSIDELMVKPKKRKLTDSDFFSDSSSSEPFPKRKPVGEFEEQLCLDESAPLFSCSICGAIHNTVGELEKHHVKHMRCPFCESNFKTMGSKKAHIKSICAVNNMMINLPSVELEKIDLDLGMRTKYPEAFIGYPLTSELQSNPRPAKETPEYDVSRNDDNIGIFADDNTRLRSENDTPISEEGIVSTETDRASSTVPSSVMLTYSSMISTAPTIITTTSSVISAASSVVSATRPVISRRIRSVSIVTPDITIKDSAALDEIGRGLSDIEVIRKLLTDTTALKKESSSQTELPCSHSICVNERRDTIELKRLRNLLFLYRIPFSFKKGDLQALYDYSFSNSKPHQTNKLGTWEDLIPIDVKVAKRFSSNDGSVQDRIPEVAKTTIHTFNPPYFGVPIQQTCSTINRPSTPVKLSDVSVHHQAVASNFATVNKDLCSNNRKYIYVRMNTAKQQSTTRTKNSFTATGVHMYPRSSNVTNELSNCLVAKSPASVQPQMTLTGWQRPGSFPTEVATRSFPTPGATGDWAERTTYPFDSSLIQRTYGRNHRFSTAVNNNAGSVQHRIPDATATNLPTPVIASYCTKTIRPYAAPILPTCSSINRSSTFSTGLSNAYVHHQVESSNFGTVNKNPSSKSRHIPVRATAADQQSNTANSFATSNIQMNPKNACMLYGLSNPPYVNPEATMARFQPPIYCPNSMRSTAIGIPNLASAETSSVACHSSVNNVTHSTIYNLQKSLTIQNIVPDAVPSLVPVTTTSTSSKSGPVCGSIRVKSLRELM